MGETSGGIRFLFDYLSHNAYLAWTQIHPLAERYGRSVEAVPVLFAGLLDAHGQLGPAEVLPKARWMVANVHRKAALLGVELAPPRVHPFNPLLSLRVSSLPMEETVRRRLVDGLFRAVWTAGRDVTDPPEVVRIAADAGLDGEAVVSEAGNRESKERLRRQTDQAIERGVFGVPTMLVGEELFFGYDDFPFLELYLAGRDPLDRAQLRKWAEVRPAAVRKRPGVAGRSA